MVCDYRATFGVTDVREREFQPVHRRRFQADPRGMGAFGRPPNKPLVPSRGGRKLVQIQLLQSISMQFALRR